MAPLSHDISSIYCNGSVFRECSQDCKKWLLASSCLSVRPSIRMEQHVTHHNNFHEILYRRISWKSVEKIQVSLKLVKNNGTLHEDQQTFFFNEKCHLPGTYGTVSGTVVISSYTTSQLGSSHTTRAAHATLSSPFTNDKSIPPTLETHLLKNTLHIPTDMLIGTFPFIKLLHYT